MQQCEVGLVSGRRENVRLKFAAAPLRGTVHRSLECNLDQIIKALRLTSHQISYDQWVENGPGWCAVTLCSASDVLFKRTRWAGPSSIEARRGRA